MKLLNIHSDQKHEENIIRPYVGSERECNGSEYLEVEGLGE